MSRTKKIVLILLPLIIIGALIATTLFKNVQKAKHYDFTLITAHNKTIHLHDFHGKKVLVYFGYGLCPDICPTSLTDIAHAFALLPKDKLSEVAAIFISVDPARDTPDALTTMAHYFHPNIIGATSDEKTVKDIADRYGVKYKKIPQPNSSIGYSMAHSADIYVIGKNGLLEQTLPFGTSAQDIAAAIRK